MVLGLTQPLKKRVPGIFPRGKGGRCVGLTTLPPSCADCLEICEPQTPGTFRACLACKRIALPLPLPLICCCLASDINAEDNRVLLFYTVQSGTCLTTFKRNLLPALSE